MIKCRKRDVILTIRINNFCKYSFVLAAFLSAGSVMAAQAINPRGSVADTEVSTAPNSARSTVSRVVRNTETDSNGTSRSAISTVSRSATARPATTVNASRTAVVQPSNSGVTGRSGLTQPAAVSTSDARSATISRAASSNVVRTAAHSPASTARAASNNSVVGAARSSAARATAVFSDISAIGGGYAECREAYATCMDQFCANANDTYRRCVCSARYDEFRNTENAIDEAVNLLAQFEDNNLNAVGLSAEEVNAMYTATEGEMAIKRDTSAAANMLAEISDLLSGKTSTTSSNDSLSNTSLGLLTVDFTSDLGDIWGDSGTSIFDTSTGVDLSSLTGEDLYTQASKQCLEIIGDSCENNAVLTMARSAYSIMITQDCNLYEKNINAQKESLEQTVRTAEKYLREARLEEYQSHNSADVNECIANVRAAIQSDVACGANYKRCLDYTGAYINQSTGEANFTPRFFQLADMILLPGVNSSSSSMDVLGANPEFNSFLDSRRMFAETALDTCRDISDIVWEEFKRQALIEIAQAQDEKIEEVKMSCVSTMAECYDTQTGALQDFDNTTSQYTGAISAYAARAMCEDKVIACASLYGDTEGCEFDGNGQLVTGNASGGLTGAAANSRCGLTALLAFVDTVDTVRVAEGCETAIDNYLADLCTPSSGTLGYPWNCRNLSPDELEESIINFAQQNCSDPTSSDSDFLTQVQSQIDRAISDVSEEMDYMMMEMCENLNGYWVDNDTSMTNITDNRVRGNEALLAVFYRDVYGGNENTDWGRCVENTTRVACLNYNDADKDPVASYDLANDECTFTDEWYETKCNLIGGYYENSICYTNKD